VVKRGDFDEWAKIQLAARRGILRAQPSASVLPDGGTSGFSSVRGSKEMAGYLAATKDKVKWNAIAVHPYGNLDQVKGTLDLDAETARLLVIMRNNGYGPETPIDYTEGFNIKELYVPEWRAYSGNDGYVAGKASYDYGWQEFIQTAQAARTYLMELKYWPQLRSQNIWLSRPFLDFYFSPLAVCMVPNTLGHLLAQPKFKADVRNNGLIAYVFEDGEGRGVAALWCAKDGVENGFEKGAEVTLGQTQEELEMIDLMGNNRKLSFSNNKAAVQLSPAPLFLRSKKGLANELVELVKAAIK